MKKQLSLIIVMLLIASIVCAVLAACNYTPVENPDNNKKPGIADNTEYYDEITKTLKLTKGYQGKSFLTDGIGSARLDAHTDGDTTRFKLGTGETISVRYYQVDTPECTSSVEKWGKAASLFTEKKLRSATEIVLEATKPGEKDSYGTRYLGYVWYKTAEDTDFKCLNLELVENGFSENEGVNTDKFPYNVYFNRAERFAISIKLRYHSDLDDPLYSTDPIPMTIKEFSENPDRFYDSDNKIGAKVQVIACLTSLKKSSSGTHMFTATQYDTETGKFYEMNIFAGYASNNASNMKLGHLYRIVGIIQNHYGAWQITDVKYDVFYGDKNPEYCTPVQRNYYYSFNSELNKDSWVSQYSEMLYTDATIVSSSISGTTLTIVATAQQRTASGVTGDVKEFTFTATVPEGYNNNFTVGRKISVDGYQFEEKSAQIFISSYLNIKLK